MSFSEYLVGTYEQRFGIRSFFQIINPTVSELKIVAAFFDQNGNYQKCVSTKLNSNDMCEIQIPAGLPPFGVVKIFSYLGSLTSTPPSAQLKPGIVGYQRHVSVVPASGGGSENAFSETVLASVPTAIAQEEFAGLKGSLVGCLPVPV